MPEITDDFMRTMMSKTKAYTVVILRATPKMGEPGTDRIVWEHARRNFALRQEGTLAVVCPIRDSSDVSGIGLFNADVDSTRKIMDEDPGVRAGIFHYEIHTSRSFPGDCLP